MFPMFRLFLLFLGVVEGRGVVLEVGVEPTTYRL